MIKGTWFCGKTFFKLCLCFHVCLRLFYKAFSKECDLRLNNKLWCCWIFFLTYLHLYCCRCSNRKLLISNFWTSRFNMLMETIQKIRSICNKGISINMIFLKHFYIKKYLYKSFKNFLILLFILNVRRDIRFEIS